MIAKNHNNRFISLGDQAGAIGSDGQSLVSRNLDSSKVVPIHGSAENFYIKKDGVTKTDGTSTVRQNAGVQYWVNKTGRGQYSLPKSNRYQQFDEISKNNSSSVDNNPKKVLQDTIYLSLDKKLG